MYKAIYAHAHNGNTFSYLYISSMNKVCAFMYKNACHTIPEQPCGGGGVVVMPIYLCAYVYVYVHIIAKTTTNAVPIEIGISL